MKFDSFLFVDCKEVVDFSIESLNASAQTAGENKRRSFFGPRSKSGSETSRRRLRIWRFSLHVH